MLNKKTVYQSIYKLLFVVSCSVLFSCEHTKSKVDIGKININSDLKRFELDLFKISKPVTIEEVAKLRANYPDFFDLFCKRIIHIPVDNDSSIAANLELFTSDKDVLAIHEKTREVFPDLTQLQEELTDLLKYYHYYFPVKPVPKMVTYISAFNYTIITTDSALGIGLDMYLGKDCSFYPALGLPKYMVDKLSKEYILRDVAKALFQSDYDPDQVNNEFLSQIIYAGKLLYYTDLIVPETADSVKIGYTGAQLNWCIKNESNIWGFMIENNLLYSKEPSKYIRYLNDGNSTQGLPKEAPAKLGAWIGWQIVKAYAIKHPDVKVEDLLKEPDAQKILSESGYKPDK
jgi:hypothetical protein